MTTAISGLFLLASCGGGTERAEETGAENTEEAAVVAEEVETTYSVAAANSKLTWKGTAVGVYSHSGTINILGGSITMSGDQLTGGKFTVDMGSIAPIEDESFNEDNTPEKLVGHLISSDFFDVENNPSATLSIKSVDGTSAIADLTIRGKTNEVTVKEIAVTPEGESISVTGKLTFNRQEYGASWGFSSGDMVLSDDIEMVFEINASK